MEMQITSILGCWTPNQPRPHVYGKGPLDLVHLDDMQKAKSFMCCPGSWGFLHQPWWNGRGGGKLPILATWDETMSRQFNALPALCFIVSKFICIAGYCLFKVSFVLLFHGSGQELFLFKKAHGRVMSVIITLANDKHKNLWIQDLMLTSN